MTIPSIAVPSGEEAGETSRNIIFNNICQLGLQYGPVIRTVATQKHLVANWVPSLLNFLCCVWLSGFSEPSVSPIYSCLPPNTSRFSATMVQKYMACTRGDNCARCVLLFLIFHSMKESKTNFSPLSNKFILL